MPHLSHSAEELCRWARLALEAAAAGRWNTATRWHDRLQQALTNPLPDAKQPLDLATVQSIFQTIQAQCQQIRRLAMRDREHCLDELRRIGQNNLARRAYRTDGT